MANIRLEVIVRNKINRHNGKQFKTYATKLKDGKWCEVRFTRDVTEFPVAYSELICESENVNFDRRNKYPICWIKGVVSIKQLERPVEDMTQYFEEVNE